MTVCWCLVAIACMRASCWRIDLHLAFRSPTALTAQARGTSTVLLRSCHPPTHTARIPPTAARNESPCAREGDYPPAPLPPRRLVTPSPPYRCHAAALARHRPPQLYGCLRCAGPGRPRAPHSIARRGRSPSLRRRLFAPCRGPDSSPVPGSCERPLTCRRA